MFGKSPSLQSEYERLALCQLLERIVLKSDREALAEFHNNRTCFPCGDRRSLRFVEYVNALHESEEKRARLWPKHCDEVLECAHALTVDKFLNLPATHGNGTNSLQEKSVKCDRTDCRKYFKAFLAGLGEGAPASARWSLQEESLAAQALPSFVRRHFYLSILECERSSNPLTSRYIWEVGGRRMYLWFPKAFPGRKRAAWLKANVADLDPWRDGEQERVQGIIDSRLGKEAMVSLDGHESGVELTPSTQLTLPWAALYGISSYGMAATVADEKAREIDNQRPQIRRLGSQGIKHLIHLVFEALDSGDLNAGKLASVVGLSEATLSRFAGTRWGQASENLSLCNIPDLWRNTAQILSRHEGFKEAAEDMGLWPRIEAVKVAANRKTRRKKRDG